MEENNSCRSSKSPVEMEKSSNLEMDNSTLKEVSNDGHSQSTAGGPELVQVKIEPVEPVCEVTETTSDVIVKAVSDNQSDDCILMEYRSAGTQGKGGDSDADSEDSSSSSDSSDDEDNKAADTKINKALSHERDASPEEIKRVKLNRHGFEDIRTKGELLPEELPPLEELTITVDENVEMNCVGRISSIVGVLVVIESSSDIPPLNDDTILFSEGYKVLGQVFEIFGPVKNPWYSVRFNDPENIKSKELSVGMPVYCAPKEESFTRYVFVDSLKHLKGSDASWEDNNEPPEKYIEYSDDEAERQAKTKKKNKKNQLDHDKTGENEEKRKKNEYNQHQQQNYTEKPSRGHRGGGNPRFSHPRGRGGNPFQGQNQHLQRPKFASGQYNQPDSGWNANNRFHGPRWPSYRQNRGDNYNNGNEPEQYTAERMPNFGGPPRFRPGPRFNGNNTRPQFQPQNQCFKNRMEQNISSNQSNWNQFNQNSCSNNQGPRFIPNCGPCPQQNRPLFPCPERLSTPPPAPPPPPPPVSNAFNHVPPQAGQFTPNPSPSSFSQFQPSPISPCPSPIVVSNQNPTSQAPAQPQVMSNQFCAVPASMVPQNATVFVPVAQMMQGAAPNMQMTGASTNTNSPCPPVQTGGQVIGPVPNGQFNPNLPPPQTNSSLSFGNAPAQHNNINSVSGCQAFQQQNSQSYHPDSHSSNQFHPSLANSNNPMQNSSPGGFPPIGNNCQSQMVQNNTNNVSQPQMRQTIPNQGALNFFPNQQTNVNFQNNRSEVSQIDFGATQQTGNQQVMTNSGFQQNGATPGAGYHIDNQPGVSGNMVPATAGSQPLPFQDAKYLQNMISAGLGQSNGGQVVMQNE